MKKYFSMEASATEADIVIYGDITSWEWMESDVSSYTLSKRLAALDPGIQRINVYINSYGGEVAEGLAILSQLKRHPAKVHTVCDGFACSAASVVFMAGDERIMQPASLLMVHHAWTYAAGNAAELRKAADDIETISTAAEQAYKEHITIDDAELKSLLDNETWITPEDAVAKGFATAIAETTAQTKAAASARSAIVSRLTATPAVMFDLRGSDWLKAELSAMRGELERIKAAGPPDENNNKNDKPKQIDMLGFFDAFEKAGRRKG